MAMLSAESPSLLGYALSGEKKDKHVSIHHPNMSHNLKNNPNPRSSSAFLIFLSPGSSTVTPELIQFTAFKPMKSKRITQSLKLLAT